MDREPSSTDAYPPQEIARRVERLGVAKARSDALTLLVLAVLAGAFISLGALFFTVVTTGSTLGFGPTRLIGGVSFALGLILVVVAGAELFTGNNLIAMAWASITIVSDLPLPCVCHITPPFRFPFSTFLMRCMDFFMAKNC